MSFKLIPNQKVRVARINNFYMVTSLQQHSTPGSYSLVNVKPKTHYLIHIDAENKGHGEIGLWIGAVDKKRLYFGNFVGINKKLNITHKIYTEKYNKILVGVLIQNPRIRSKYFFNKLSVNEIVFTDNTKNNFNNDVKLPIKKLIHDKEVKKAITVINEDSLKEIKDIFEKTKDDIKKTIANENENVYSSDNILLEIKL